MLLTVSVARQEALNKSLTSPIPFDPFTDIVEIHTSELSPSQTQPSSRYV
jgi:hypothetical protein